MKERCRNGVLLMRSGWESGRGQDRDVVWAAVHYGLIVAAWYGTAVGVRECWVLGSSARRDPALYRFAAWRRAVQQLQFQA